MSAQFSYNQSVRPIAIIIFVSFVLGATGLSQINTSPSSPLSDPASHEPKNQGQSPANPSTSKDAPALALKMCGPKNPAPCAQVPPRALKSPAPKYSKEAREGKVQGDVVLLLVVGTGGKPTDISVQRPLGFGLDEEAIKAVKKWRFQPATMDGNAVAVKINVMVHFHLN